MNKIVKILNRLFHRDNLIIIERDKLDKLLMDVMELKVSIINIEIGYNKMKVRAEVVNIENEIIELYCKEK